MADVDVDVSRTVVANARNMFMENTAAVRFIVALPPNAAQGKTDHQLACDAAIEVVCEMMKRDA